MSAREDRRHLAHAIALARGDEARTSPNPTVGCVLVAPDGTVVGAGRTEPAGGRHAEVVALAEAGGAAVGATAYVTLEPCDHHGRTGPCSVALVDAGVGRVVAARRDPVPGHGGGLARLRAAGISAEVVDTGGWATAVTRRFLRRASTGRPWVTLKVAHARDGSTVPSSGEWITGPAARHRVHAQRATHDAVLVGIGTVLADDPRLDVRHVDAPHGQPRPVVLDSDARTPVDATVARRGALLLVADRGPADGPHADRVRRLRDAGAEVVVVPVGEDGRTSLDDALATVQAHGLHSVYAEPGDTLATALVLAGSVDELVLHRPLGDPTGAPAALAHGRWVRTSSLALGDDREDVLLPVPTLPSLLDALAAWSARQADVRGLALVGSHARGEAGPDSDVDLVVLVDDVGRRLADRDWLEVGGQPTTVTVEDWGRVTSLRVRYAGGPEVEYGLATPDWVADPIDDGSAAVIRAGMRVLHDPAGHLADAVARLAPS